MNFIKKNINELKYADYNPRKKLTPKDKEYQKIKRSIEEFGYVDPIIINKDNTIIGGHQRVTVLKDLGYKEINVIQIDIDKTKEKALNIALNKITGSWDYALLGDLLLELDAENYDLEITGFDLDEIEDLMAPIDYNEIEEDDYEVELPEESKAKYGDIYQLGNHRLMCGDSTNIDDVQKLMNGQKADMVFTDPPYNADYSSRVDKNKRKPWGGILNDNMTHEDFEEFLIDIHSCLWEVMKNGSSIYECIDWKHYSQLENQFKEAFNQKSTIVWNKNYFGLGTYYRTKYELILFGVKGDKVNIWNAGHDEMDVWEEDREKVNNYKHPTQKPLTLPSRAIKNSSNITNIVLDLFGGSGSTLIACEQLNRKCYMMELDPKYIDVIIDRWEKLTGKKAKKIKGGN